MMFEDLMNAIKEFFKQLNCKHEHKKTLYCDIEGWADLSYCITCEDCGKQWSR